MRVSFKHGDSGKSVERIERLQIEINEVSKGLK